MFNCRLCCSLGKVHPWFTSAHRYVSEGRCRLAFFLYNKSMETAQTRATRVLDALFRTGYPHPINLFVALMLFLLPLLEGTASGFARPASRFIAGVLVAIFFLLAWTRIRVYNPERPNWFIQIYLVVQTVLVSAVYVLSGGLTRFLFVVVAVQAVYVSPARRWGPYLGTLGVLWLTLYLVISPNDPSADRVSIIGMYASYLIFAAVITYTSVQQERQVRVAQDLLDLVGERNRILQEHDSTVEHLAEVEERERLARTIYATLSDQLARLLVGLDGLAQRTTSVSRAEFREARLQAKAVLGQIRDAVRTLRPDDTDRLEDDEGESLWGPAPSVRGLDRAPDPMRVLNTWNLVIIIVTVGVFVASDLVAGTSRWLALSALGVGLLTSFTGSLFAVEPRIRTLYLVFQAGFCVSLVWLSQEPLMNHLLMIVASQIVFLVPLANRWVLGAVLFPTGLTAVTMWATGLFHQEWLPLVGWTAAFAVTYFFSAVMSYMTRRQLEARHQAVLYATQMAEVNRLLEARLQELRRMVIAGERIRLAREIHDSWGHHLTLSIMELQYAEALATEEGGAAGEHLSTAREVVAAAWKAGSEMILSLERFDRPLPEAISQLVAAWQAGNRPAVMLDFRGNFVGIPAAVGIALYRAVQESLTNIQKHAKARRVEISLVRHPDRVVLRVSNDSGSDRPTGTHESSGFGLIGLRERTEALLGEFQAGAGPDGGFQVQVVLPLGG